MAAARAQWGLSFQALYKLKPATAKKERRKVANLGAATNTIK
jgi:hypothetical protein